MKPIVFVGPSIGLAEAKNVIDADYRPPCRRGDLNAIRVPAVVAIIDGVFEQSLAISPTEILHAVRRGVYICGGGSMGALRAAEVPEMHGIGRVYEMYSGGLIDDDDEVALLFDPDRLVPLTIPLVNVRFAVDRLVDSGTIGVRDGQRILATARALHFKERTYQRILRELGLSTDSTAGELLLPLLQAHDIKRTDAVRVLEHLKTAVNTYLLAGNGNIERQATCDSNQLPGGDAAYKSTDQIASRAADLFIWETGDQVDCKELLDFLVTTNRFSAYASRVLCRLLLANAMAEVPIAVAPPLTLRRAVRQCHNHWGWQTPEEAKVTLRDLGLTARDVLEGLRADELIAGSYQALMRSRLDLFLKAFRIELFLNDIALKRETMLYGSIRQLGSARGRYRARDMVWAHSLLCRLHGTPVWQVAESRILAHGVGRRRLRTFLAILARAHHAVTSGPRARMSARRMKAMDERIGLQSSKKPAGEQRFSVSTEEAFANVQTIKQIIGATRVGFVDGLTDLTGVFLTQVSRPGGAWSSSYGSGKSYTRDGAIVGGVMEEVEKWANEQFTGAPILASYAELRRDKKRVLDPRLLDLPHDSEYTPLKPLLWHKCLDLIGGFEVFVPLAALACHFNAGENNPFFSPRAGRVVFSTNGLASGFTLAEALLHATCECIERHNTKIVELQIENPGLAHRMFPPRGLDGTEGVPDIQRLIEELKHSHYAPQLFDISVDVRVPTVAARLIRDGVIYSGWGAHPNPTVACRAALLEACQTVGTMTAGGREDLSVHARSLGRHERPRPNRDPAFVLWDSYHRDRIRLADVFGCECDDIYDEFQWVRARLVDAGIEHLIAVDLSREEILPAKAVRVVIPGLETVNPFNCGLRARRIVAAEVLSA